MSKVITAKELIKIVELLEQDIDDNDQYERFLEDLATTVCAHAGGELVCVSAGEDIGHCVHIAANECLPGDGGVFKDFDPDVVWTEGEEKEN